MDDVTRITDVRALRALSHPLRSKLLGLLRLDGPSTATLLGARVGESSGSTSYHLRQLAAYGFVEEVDRGGGRQRWWRSVHRTTRWTVADVQGQDGAEEVAEELLRHQVGSQGRLLEAWLDQRTELGPDWRDAGSTNDWALRLDPAQAEELLAELNAILRRWWAAHPVDEPADGTETVAVLLDLLPLRQWPV